MLGRLPRKDEHLGRKFDQLFANFQLPRVVFDVIVAVGQRQSTLVEIRNHCVSIVKIGIGIEVKQCIVTHEMHSRNGIHQRRLVTHRGDPVQLGPQRIKTFSIYCLFVHAGAVEVADLLFGGGSAGVIDRGFF